MHSLVRRLPYRSIEATIWLILGYEGQNAKDINGGMTIYYTQKDFNTPDLEHPVRAFPPVSYLISVTNFEPTLNGCIGLPNDCW